MMQQGHMEGSYPYRAIHGVGWIPIAGQSCVRHGIQQELVIRLEPLRGLQHDIFPCDVSAFCSVEDTSISRHVPMIMDMLPQV